MKLSRKDLFKKLYDELLDQGFIDENNYTDASMSKREFVKSVETFFQDYYILDQLHEIEWTDDIIGKKK